MKKNINIFSQNFCFITKYFLSLWAKMKYNLIYHSKKKLL